MEEYTKSLEEQNQILKDLNDVNNRLISSYQERILLQEQIILLYKQKIEKYENC
jgi:hypothetical protein